MRLLDFVEQHHGVRAAADLVGELATFIVAHVSRRRSDETADGEFLLKFAHIEPHDGILGVEQIFRQRLGQLGLTHAGRTHEDERADRFLAVLQAGTAPADGVGDGADGLVLSHHTLVQLLFEMQQFRLLALHHLADRYARPARHHIGDVVFAHLLVDHGLVTLHGGKLLLEFLDVVLGVFDEPVAQLGHTAVVALPLLVGGLQLIILNEFFVLLDLVHDVFLGAPLGFQGVALLLQFRDGLGKCRDFLRRVFAFDGLALNLQLADFTLNLIQLFRLGIDFEFQLRGGLVDQVNSLVGQETVGDVPLRKFHGGDEGVVHDSHMVVIFIAFLQSTQDRDGRIFVGFGDEHGLETTLESLILLEVLLVLVEGGGTDGAQFATRQRRFQNVGGVHGTLARRAGPHQRVNLINEEDDFAVGVNHLLDDALQTFLKLALVFGTGHQRTHVQ